MAFIMGTICFIIVIGLLVLLGIVVWDTVFHTNIILKTAYGQEWTYDDCVNDFDPVTCDVMFPPIPLESI